MDDFQRLVGEQLSVVCFVQDYLQLESDGYKLTTYTTPLVETTPKPTTLRTNWFIAAHNQEFTGRTSSPSGRATSITAAVSVWSLGGKAGVMGIPDNRCPHSS